MSTHERGTQDISHHQDTYKLIMDVTVWASALIVVSVLFFTLIFAANFSWLTALIISFLVSVATGMFLKRGGAWYGVMVGLAVFTLITSMAISFIAGLG